MLFANSWFSVLARGVTSADFQVVGNMLDSIEVLIIDVITGRIGARQSFKTRTEIFLIPGALIDGIVDIMRSISSLPIVLYSAETAHKNGIVLEQNIFGSVLCCIH